MQNTVAAEYSPISEVLEKLHSTKVVPVGAFGKMFTILDRLRATRAPAEHIELAEQISVAFHRLELARRKQDPDAAECAFEQLKVLSDLWAETSISRPMTTGVSVEYDAQAQMEAAA